MTNNYFTMNIKPLHLKKQFCLILACVLPTLTALAGPPEYAKEELLKIAETHRSQPTNPVFVTSNLLFSVSSRDYHLYPATEFKVNDELIWGLEGNITNFIWYRRFPAGNFDFHLFDESGKEIPKTKAGLAYTGIPKKPTRYDLTCTRKYYGNFVNSEGGEFRRLFRVDDMFNVTNTGSYTLEVKINLCVIMTNGAPDISAMLDARNILPSSYKFADTFGVLTSPPLRVRITKGK